MDTDVLRLWTTLDDHSDGSGDELDELEPASVVVFTRTSSSKLKSPTGKGKTFGKSAHVASQLKNLNSDTATTPTSVFPVKLQSPLSKRIATSESSARRSRERPSVLPDSSGHRATKRAKTEDSDSQVRSLNASNYGPFNVSTSPSSVQTEFAEPGLADALSLAFNKNAEDPYPSPKTLLGNPRASLKRFSNGSIALNGNRQRDHLTDVHSALVRKVKRRRDPPISQEEIDEYLDVHITPIYFDGSDVDEYISETDVSDENKPSNPCVESSLIKDSRSRQAASFNLRHIMARRSRGRNSPPTETVPPYGVSGQSYTAMYLERVGRWIGDNDPHHGPEEEEPERTNHEREIIINPSPQIPRRGASNTALAIENDQWDGQTTTSFETDEILLRDANATPPPESDDGNSVTIVNGILIGPVESDSNHDVDSQSETSGNSILPSGSLVDAITLLQRLVKGKIKLSDAQVQSTRKFLETMGSSDDTIYSAEFERSAPEDRVHFLQLVSKLCSRTASSIDLPGVEEGEARLIKKYARMVVQRYDQPSS